MLTDSSFQGCQHQLLVDLQQGWWVPADGGWFPPAVAVCEAAEGLAGAGHWLVLGQLAGSLAHRRWPLVSLCKQGELGWFRLEDEAGS